MENLNTKSSGHGEVREGESKGNQSCGETGLDGTYQVGEGQEVREPVRSELLDSVGQKEKVQRRKKKPKIKETQQYA